MDRLQTKDTAQFLKLSLNDILKSASAQKENELFSKTRGLEFFSIAAEDPLISFEKLFSKIEVQKNQVKRWKNNFWAK